MSLFFLITNCAAFGEGTLVPRGTAHLDENVDEEFEVVDAVWSGARSLAVLTADGSVVMLNGQRIAQTLRSGKTSFNANGFALSESGRLAAVATTTGVTVYERLRSLVLPGTEKQVSLAVGFREGSSVVVVAKDRLLVMARKGQKYGTVHELATPDLYAAAIAPGGSIVAVVDYGSNLRLYRIDRQGSIDFVCKGGIPTLSRRIAFSGTGVLLAVNLPAGGEIVAVDSGCRMHRIIEGRGRILGLSASKDRLALSTETTVEVWSIRDGHLIASVSVEAGATLPTLSSDGRTLGMINGSRVQFWEIDTD